MRLIRVENIAWVYSRMLFEWVKTSLDRQKNYLNTIVGLADAKINIFRKKIMKVIKIYQNEKIQIL